MVEGDWHEKTRNELIEKYSKEGYKVASSHSGDKIFLFKDSLKRENCLSDVDLVLLKDNKVVTLIEIQQSLRPKELIGIISATNLTNKCQIDNNEYLLSDVSLIIVVNKQKEKSRKQYQLDVIKNNLNLQDGCLKSFEFVESD